MKNQLWALILFGSAIAAQPLRAADAAFRTDINPALLYYQGFSLRPDLSPQDHDYLFTNQWRNQVLDDKFGKLMSSFDNPFKLFRRAAGAAVPCDWGLDLTDGPNALLPGLAKAKWAAQSARLRALWHLQNGKPNDARDDLLAAFTLGRNVATDRVLISALVQCAIENLVAASIAENLYQLPPEILRSLAEGIEAAPPRGLVADCVPTENVSFSQYYIREIQKEPRTLEDVRELLTKAFTGEGETSGAGTADKVLRAGGNSVDGVLRLFQELPPLYQQVEGILRLPPAHYANAMAEFLKTVTEHPNPLVKEFFGVFDNCRKKELGTEITLAMVRAGIEYRLKGPEGLRAVRDPATGEPFQFERFVFEGADRGFRLRSSFRARDFDEILIFVEKPGPVFQVMGKRAGEKIN